MIDKNKKTKIAFYINVLIKGGAERVMSQLANQFSEHGYEVYMITSFQDEEEYTLGDQVKRINLEKEQDFGDRIKRNIRLIFKLRRVLKSIKPDMIVSFMQEPNFRAILAARGLGIKNIVSVRNDPNKEYGGKIGWIVGKVLLPLADGCVFETEEARSWFPRKLQKKSKIIFNEVDKSFFDTEWHPKGQTVVTIGRLAEQKNQQMLIKAFSGIASRFPVSRLEIYGEGPLKDQLQELINTLHIQDRAFLMGNIDHVNEVLSKARVFVLPSDYEGMPNALLEALAVGVPCIATDCPCGGPRMLIKNGVNGFLISVGDAEGLQESIQTLLLDEQMAENISLAETNTARKFKSDKVYQEWNEYFELIMRANTKC